MKPYSQNSKNTRISSPARASTRHFPATEPLYFFKSSKHYLPHYTKKAKRMALCSSKTLTPSFSINPSKPSFSSSKPSESRTSMAASKRIQTPSEARFSLVLALASQAFSLSQRLLTEIATETRRYAFPRRFESRNLEEALMSVPDLETLKFRVLSRNERYEIREVEPYFVAETTMPGKSGFDFNGSSQAFNALASYLFGKNTSSEKMEMTTPVFTQKGGADGERMEMTTPVITTQSEDRDSWQMSFLMPSKYGADLPSPKDSTISLREVPKKIVAVAAFSGFVTDEEVKNRELKLRDALKSDKEFQIKENSVVEVAQYNPPFTLPFTRRNEIALEVERKNK